MGMEGGGGGGRERGGDGGEISAVFLYYTLPVLDLSMIPSICNVCPDRTRYLVTAETPTEEVNMVFHWLSQLSRSSRQRVEFNDSS